MSANESFPRPWRVERNPKNGLQNIVVAANGRLIAEPLPIDGATAEDCEAVAAEIAAVQRGGGNAAEPLSAILAEMCELAHGFANGEVCATARKVRQWVSRIEAAADREHLRDATKMAGNAAAMREALESIIENLAIHIKCGRFSAPGDHVSFPIIEAEAYIRDARAALSAPARNCDRAKDAAEDLFKERFGRPWTQAEDELAAWLFAPMTKNGENEQ